MKPIFYMLFLSFIISFDTTAQTNTFPSNGAAGIGTTTPDASSLLEIKSTKKGLLISRMTKNQRDAITTPATGLLIYQTNSAPGFYYYDGSKWTSIAPSGNTPGGWSLTGNAGTTSANYLGTSDNRSLRIKTKNVQRVIVDSSGRVGIGTTSPGAMFDVKGLGIFGGQTTSIGSATGLPNERVMLFYDGNVARARLNCAANVSLGFGTSGVNDRVVIDNIGNMGIGTTSPGSRLEVVAKYDGDGIAVIGSSSGPKDAGFKLNDNLGHSGSLGLASANNAFMSGVVSGDIVLSNTSGKIHFGTGSASAFPVMTVSGGAVGIGTMNPGYVLDVGARMRIRSGGSTSGTWLMNVANTVDAAFLGMLNDDYVGMYGTGIGWGFIMNTTTGNVGIGTFNPTNKLSVNGTIQSKEVRVETGWSDYVFEKDYQLRSLDNVAEYIAQNKHLPGIPSAKEIQDNGLAVGEVQTKMMAKIEELTLYVIEQEKSINNLKEQNARLEAKMNLLVKKGGK